MQNTPPSNQNQILPSNLSNLWEQALTKVRSPIAIDLDKLSDLLECVVTFEKPQIKHDEDVQIKLFLR